MSIASELQTAQQQGLDNLSRDQQITFTQYARQVVSDDGSVFWAQTSEILTVKGSLHYGTERDQAEDQTIGVNSVIFTAQSEVTAFNSINAGILWIAEYDVDGGGSIEIAFSSRGSFYQQAGTYHYAGFAVYPALKSQLIANASDLPVGPIVSNSLPIWLSQNSMAPVYPSFLVPENIVPPYIVAHIDPDLTEPLQAAPLYLWPGTIPNPNGPSPMHDLPVYQLTRDHVSLILYGFTNQQAWQFLSSLISYSLDSEAFGFCGTMPVPKDDKRAQSEIAAIAMRKTLSFDANYNQTTADAIARNLIVSASISYN